MGTFKAFWVEKKDKEVRQSIIDRSIDELPESEVLIRVLYSSLNYKDALSAKGLPGVTRNYPHTPGIDVSGVVEASSAPSLKKGDEVISSKKTELNVGNCLELRHMPTDTLIHNIELKPGKGAQLCRSAGTYGQLIGKDSEYAQLKLSSGEIRLVRVECRATIGMVSNPDKKNIKLGKAGRKRWLGIRPVVRGVAMNPVDHPHGGGEGRTSGGRNPVSRKGFSAKGKKTRNNKRTDKLILKRRKR